MKRYLILACLGLTACAHKEPIRNYAPSPAGIVRSLSTAKAKASILKDSVTPAGQVILAELHTSLDTTIAQVGEYSAKVDDLSSQLGKAEESVVYEHSKRVKALKEVWFWRLAAMSLAASIAIWIGIRTSWRFIV